MLALPIQTLGEQPKEFLRKYHIEVAACTSSVVSTTTAFPLDSIKTRMQTYRYPSVAECARQTYKSEKLRGFFRGVAAPVMSVTVVRTCSFSVYTRAKKFYSSLFEKAFNYNVLDHVARPGAYPNPYTIACFGASGATAGALVSFMACPFELTKLSAQVSVLLAAKAGQTGDSEKKRLAESYKNKGTFQTMAHILRNRGPLGLYTGFNLHLVRDTIGTGVYFMVYESGKQITSSIFGSNPDNNKLSVAVAGGLCGVLSWAVIYPVDSVKSIYQRNSLTSLRGEKVPPAPRVQFFKRNMYRGLGVSITRSAVVNAVFFTFFEGIKKDISKGLSQDEVRKLG
ncbi:mitochondrial carrier protein [Ceratocystis lukuohia]|uniref:Mitochondrial carrier protein n=2 Tax=Ceratocystis TaxID=5157 RepID=A0ABR4MR50_9PEZI|nr:putative mitochondrial carrier C29A3.11c [Ceratocystis fimbriata CBS 114723]